jgi:hypothetical protein
MTPREFCQYQLLLLGDEELTPAAQAASLAMLHSTIMDDPDAEAFERKLVALVAGGTTNGNVPAGAEAQVAKVLLEGWRQMRDDARPV